MSKQGNPLVRRELYLLAFRTLSREDYLRSIYIYARQRAKGKEHEAALGVLMHKLLRIIYGMLKNGKPFNPGTHQLNQASKKEPADKQTASQQAMRSALRRFQEESPDAPISDRQSKKRRSGHEPQAADPAECAGSS